MRREVTAFHNMQTSIRCWWKSWVEMVLTRRRQNPKRIREANKNTQLTSTAAPYLDPSSWICWAKFTLGSCKDHKFSSCPAQTARWPLFQTDQCPQIARHWVGVHGLRALISSTYLDSISIQYNKQLLIFSYLHFSKILKTQPEHTTEPKKINEKKPFTTGMCLK